MDKEDWLPEDGGFAEPTDPLTQLHDLSFKNRFLMELEGTGSCFDCFSYIKVEEVKRWVDGEQTALCPYCGIDSVLPGKWDPKTIQAMYDRWFKEVTTLKV